MDNPPRPTGQLLLVDLMTAAKWISLRPPPKSLAVTAFANDPAQKVSVKGHTVTISGVANNRGIIGSSVQRQRQRPLPGA